MVDVLSRHPVSGVECVDVVQRFVLETLAKLELGLLARPPDQELAYHSRHGRITFSRLDAGSAMNVVVDRDCDIFIVTVSHDRPRRINVDSGAV